MKKNRKESVSINCPLKTFWNFLIIFVIANTVIRNDLIRNKLVLRNHFPWSIANLLHKDKEILAFTNNFRVTKKFLITKYDCTLAFCGLWHFFLPGYSTNFVTLITILFLWISTKNWLTALSNSFSYIFLSLCTHNWHHTTALLSKKKQQWMSKSF